MPNSVFKRFAAPDRDKGGLSNMRTSWLNQGLLDFACCCGTAATLRERVSHALPLCQAKLAVMRKSACST